MPRTKVSKNSKRNREVSNLEEKINNFERKVDVVFNDMDELEMQFISTLDTRIKSLTLCMQVDIREMKMPDFIDVIVDLVRFSDFKASDHTQMIASMSVSQNTTDGHSLGVGMGGTVVSGNRNDEEDSSLGGLSSASTLSAFGGASSMLKSAKALRTPGPLHSARARRARRSRSACGDMSALHSARPPAVVPSSSASSRVSRNKMRTPMATRPKAFSADRNTPMGKKMSRNSSPSTPPVAFLRYPKPGEMALSKFGSPMVVQAMPDKFANVNIPIRNGVLSLRPKRLAADEVETDLLQALDEDTLNQIKTLHANLQVIVNTANKAGLK
ncbi:borealin isoform X2 [Drosophila willistoni]|uniref:borealin isoform X2 n=1 Tax=Drosophila willistoni TaxID=7260 RepID=UPI000C26CC9C|nr:borealin isoform X2 [Drosophila willistoni]